MVEVLRPLSAFAYFQCYPLQLENDKEDDFADIDDNKMEEAVHADESGDLLGADFVFVAPDMGSRVASRQMAQDHYKLLHLENKRWNASEDDIRRAYRETSLRDHPDKVPTEERAAAEERFKNIQLANEVLGDVLLRRAFDSCSAFPFDASVPATVPEPAAFYKTFRNLFSQNARFSVLKPVPSLGNAQTDIDKVHEFYNFWFHFQSWRDCTDDDDMHDPSCADSRDERRWMLRENERMRSKWKKGEVARLQKLVELAYRSDPRIKADLEAQKAAKKAHKVARAIEREENEKKAREEAEIRRKEEEIRRALAAAEEKQRLEEAKEKKREEKEKMKRARRELRRFMEEEIAPNETEWINIDRFLNVSSCEEIEKASGHLSKRLQGNPLEIRAWLSTKITLLNSKTATTPEAANANSKKWSNEQIAQLQSGIKEYPKELGDERWIKIAEGVEGKDIKECKKKFMALLKEFQKRQQS